MRVPNSKTSHKLKSSEPRRKRWTYLKIQIISLGSFLSSVINISDLLGHAEVDTYGYFNDDVRIEELICIKHLPLDSFMLLCILYMIIIYIFVYFIRTAGMENRDNSSHSVNIKQHKVYETTISNVDLVNKYCCTCRSIILTNNALALTF